MILRPLRFTRRKRLIRLRPGEVQPLPLSLTRFGSQISIEVEELLRPGPAHPESIFQMELHLPGSPKHI